MILLNKQDEIAIGKLKSQFFKGTLYKECFYCGSSDVINAHSIQNNRILSKISKNGHVLSVEYGMEDMILKPELKEIGKKKASTFTGFCNFHDTEIFQPIELQDYETENRKQEYLFAYRALSKEFHAKKTGINIFNKILNMSKDELKELQEYCGLPKKEINKEFLKPPLEGTKDSIEELKSLRIRMNKNLDNEKHYKIMTNVIKFPKEHHIAVSSSFFIGHDVEGNVINDLIRFKNVKPLFLTIFPQNGNTYILFSYLKNDKNYFDFIENQIMNKDLEKKKTIISNILAINVENIFFSPKLWNNINTENKERFISLFRDTVIERPSTSFVDPNINIFI